MKFRDFALMTFYRTCSSLFLDSGDNANWIYEKVQRPQNAVALAANMVSFYLRLERLPSIITLMVEPVFGCNLSCKYCFCWGENAPDLKGLRPHLMPLPLFKKIIDEVPSSIECLTFASLGEPLLHPELHTMIDYAEEHNIRTVVISNGTLLTGDRLKKLAASKLSVLTVSVEADPNQSLDMRGVDPAIIRANVDEFLAVKRPETEVKLSIVVHPDNAENALKIHQDWDSQVKIVKANPLMGYEGLGPAMMCMELWRGNVSVFSDGQVTPCCIDCIPDLSIGDINDQSFSEIIKGQSFRDLIIRIVSGKSPKRCLECSEFTVPGLARKAPKIKPRSK